MVSSGAVTWLGAAGGGEGWAMGSLGAVTWLGAASGGEGWVMVSLGGVTWLGAEGFEATMARSKSFSKPKFTRIAISFGCGRWLGCGREVAYYLDC